VGAAGLHRAVCHSQLPSLSRQNIRWMLHPNTLPAAAGQCYSYIIAADRMDGWPMHGGVCGGGEGGVTGRRACRRASASTSSPRSSLPLLAVTRGQSMDGRAARCTPALTGRQRSTAHEDDAAAVLRTVPVPRCN